MKKYNIWNKIFHKRELNKNVADYKLQQGLVNTRTIAQWEDSTQTCYDIVLCAYKRLLKSNIIALADNAKLLVAEYQQNNYKL